MTSKLSKQGREQLRQVILDCTLRRLTTKEALEYIKQKLRVKITDRYFYTVKKNIVVSSGAQLSYLQQNRNAYLAQYFERIAEQYNFQHELWQMYQEAKEDNDKNLQISCIKELQEVSCTLTTLYNMLPEIKGLHFESDNEKYTGRQWATEREAAEYSREAKFGPEDMTDNPEYRV
jgi:hypothetical protein